MSGYAQFKKVNKGIGIKKTKTSTLKRKRMLGYTDDWNTISKTCLELASYRCACGSRATQAHHIVPLSKGGSNLQINLKAVCSDCHEKQHKHLRKKKV